VRVTRPKVTQAELADKYPVVLVADRNSFKLRLYKSLTLVKEYTVAVGAVGFDTPAGMYHIQNKAVSPTWTVPNSDWAGDLAGQVIPPGPDNPLKARWMGIYDGAGIHGTEETYSLGTAASHGCLRMAIPDVIELYDQVDVGTPIYIA
jgi:lipoprotein-anchoring transpeptidase ErfK/SrfK